MAEDLCLDLANQIETFNVENMISIIVPTFNSDKTISQTISSILSQSFRDFELLVIDNYSSDNTKKIVTSFLDDRIHFFSVDNQGVPAISRNYGASIAKYNYLAFCDSDDTWAENKLLVCVECIKNGAEFIAHDLHITGSFSKLLASKVFPRKFAKNFNEAILLGNTILQSSVIIKLQTFLNAGSYNINEKYTAIEDFHLWAKVLKSGVEISYIHQKLGTLSYSPLALSSSANQFRSNRAFRLDFSPRFKPSWYKYNIAIYLLRKKMYRRSSLYLKSLCFDSACSIEIRLKATILWMKTCIH